MTKKKIKISISNLMSKYNLENKSFLELKKMFNKMKGR